MVCRWNGGYPITNDEFAFVESLMPFTAFDENGIWGFFTFRNPSGSTDELRLGFVIIDSGKRGVGYEKAIYSVLGEEWNCKELKIEKR